MGKRRQQVRLVGLALALALVAAACGGGDDEGGGGDQQATPEKGGVLRAAISDFGFTNGFDRRVRRRGDRPLRGDDPNLMGVKHVAGPPATSSSRPGRGPRQDLSGRPEVHLQAEVGRQVGAAAGPRRHLRGRRLRLPADQHGPAGRPVRLLQRRRQGMDGKAKSAETKISGIETPDDQTIIFNLEKPTGDFLYRLDHAGRRADPKEVAKCFTRPATTAAT